MHRSRRQSNAVLLLADLTALDLPATVPLLLGGEPELSAAVSSQLVELKQTVLTLPLGNAAGADELRNSLESVAANGKPGTPTHLIALGGLSVQDAAVWGVLEDARQMFDGRDDRLRSGLC